MAKLLWISLLFLPSVVQGAVLINEVAWMGTEVNANDEWIELYNNGTEEVSLTGWSLSDNISLEIPLAGSIGAGAYAPLERTDDTSVLDVHAFLIYTGALGNEGRTLTLFRPDASIEDQVAGGENWESIGGDNTTKHTAQRTVGGWVTNTPTPGSANNDTAEDDTPEDTVATSSESVSNTSSTKKKPQMVKLTDKEHILELTLHAPSRAYTNQVVEFEVIPKGAGRTVLNSLVYAWNFGDTYTATSKNPTHSFAYAGEYIVVVEAEFAKKKAIMRHEITILPVTLSLARSDGGDILIHNNARYEIDISGYQLYGTAFFIFPEHTILKAGGTLTVPPSRVDATKDSLVSLYDTERRFVTNSKEVAVKEVVSDEPLLNVTYTPPSKESEPVFIPIGPQVMEEKHASSTIYADSKSLVMSALFLGLMSVAMVIRKMRVP